VVFVVMGEQDAGQGMPIQPSTQFAGGVWGPGVDEDPLEVER
jgi:hypothetical protein